MIRQPFVFERIATPTGRMLLLTDDERRRRAADWEDHEARMRRRLQRHYGDAIQLRDSYLVRPRLAQASSFVMVDAFRAAPGIDLCIR